MNIALLGYGTVGGGVDALLKGKSDIDITRIYCRGSQERLGGRGNQTLEDIIGDPDIDTVVEAMGGLTPAWEFTSAALTAGKNFVTANKALVAAYLPQMLELSKKYGGALRCTAAVGGGIPWLTGIERCRRLDNIVHIWGILNGTTNYILDAMTTKGADFAETLAEAQKLGYAEADPTADIDGWDVRRKLVISIAAAFDTVISEEEIPMFGIRNVTAMDITNFNKMGRVCKLIAEAAVAGNDVTASVEPLLITKGALEAAVPANYNLVAYESENAGWQSFFGQGAGRFPTAYNVVQDCLDIQSGVTGFYTDNPKSGRINENGLTRSYYVRTDSEDGWLEKITAEKLDGAVITQPVSQQEMHRWAKKTMNTDKKLFIAGIK